MTLENDQAPNNVVDGNKDENEVPIGDVQDVEARENTMWRCGECGEMGTLRETLPEECPNCAASKEALLYQEED